MATADSRAPLVVIFGGRSAEHDVSCVTAAHVMRAMDPTKYRVSAIGIGRDGSWHQPLLPSRDGSVDIAALPERLVVDGPAIDAFAVLSAAHDEHRDTVVVPLLHGPFGEDGTMQGLLEMLNLPYVGSGVLASAVAMDKAIAKTVLASAGVAQVNYVALRDDQINEPVLRDVIATVGLPMFVKPANMGSSVGVTKAHDMNELVAAVNLAASYDEWILCEEAVTGREIEVAVLGNRSPRASLPGEIVPAKEFYDYADKYESNSAQLLTPAPLDADATATVRDLAIRAYNALRCEGMARVDFFYEENGRGFLCNEVNTIPGFTPISMYPRMWDTTGVSYSSLIDELIELARERHRRRRHNTAH